MCLFAGQDLDALAFGFYQDSTLQNMSAKEKLEHILFDLAYRKHGHENQISKGVVHVQISGDPPNLVKSALDYRTLVDDGKEKDSSTITGSPTFVNAHTLLEAFMEKMLQATYFSIIKIATGNLDGRVLFNIDPAYCTIGNRVVVCSSHFDYHMGHLRNLFFLFRDWGIKVVPEKSYLAKRSVSLFEFSLYFHFYIQKKRNWPITYMHVVVQDHLVMSCRVWTIYIPYQRFKDLHYNLYILFFF